MSSAQSIINELNSVIGGFTSQVDSRINVIDQQTETARRNAETALGKIHNFKEKMIKDEQMQAATENILRLDQVIREKFESNIKVRKTVSGVVKEFDINLCRNSTIEELSEELWITSSRYWLSFALIALSAWVNDSKALATNAVSEAVHTNEMKANLFFCLVNLRFGRLEPAKAWLMSYFRSVVPTAIQDETSVLIQAYINGVFGVDKSIEFEVQSVVDEWIKQINLDEDLSEELVRDYEKYIANIQVRQGFSCPHLMKFCENAAELKTPYLESFKYAPLIALVESLDVEAIVQNASEYKKRIDIIINDLITNYDEEEQEIKNQREYFQLIVDSGGDVEVAEAQFAERMRVRNQTQSIGRKLLDWVVYKGSDEIDVHVRKFALQNSRVWFTEALERWSSDMEESFPTKYNITIDDWSCESDGEDAYTHETKFKEHLEENKYRTMYFNNTNIKMLVGFVLALVAGIALLTTGMMEELGTYLSYGLFGVAAVLAIILTVRCLTAGSKFRKMVKEKLALLSGCFAELASIRKAYFENISNKNKLFNLIEHL